MPVAYLSVIAVAVYNDDIEVCRKAFDLLLHMQQQVTGRVHIGLMVPLKENEPWFAMIFVAIHVPIWWLLEQEGRRSETADADKPLAGAWR